MSAALEQYLALTRKLLQDRAVAPNGELSMDEETRRTDELDELWWKMTEAEHGVAEEAIEAVKVEFKERTP